jgi:hypothetical protein
MSVVEDLPHAQSELAVHPTHVSVLEVKGGSFQSFHVLRGCVSYASKRGFIRLTAVFGSEYAHSSHASPSLAFGSATTLF